MPDIHLDLLSQVHIASPCEAKWEDMVGDGRSRLCGQCELHVHNISTMTRDEANAFLAEKIGAGERVCGRIYRRRDGTILTRDCPVGPALVRKRLWKATARIAAAIGLASLAAWSTQACERQASNWEDWGWAIRLRSTPVVKVVLRRLPSSPYGWTGGVIHSPPSPQPPRRPSNNDYFGPHHWD